MAYGLARADREELKDKQLLSLRAELRTYRLNASGMNKIVRSASATLYNIKGGLSLRELSLERYPKRSRGGRLASARENNRGARNDKTHCTVTESGWIIASSRVEPQNKKRAYFRHMHSFSQSGAVG
jgi:hypothetical protein